MQFDCRHGLGTCNAYKGVSHTLQSALESGNEAGNVQIYFCATFDKVNRQELS